jgi:hypothetical protein
MRHRGAAYFFRFDDDGATWIFESMELLRPEMISAYVPSYPSPNFDTTMQPSFGWSTALVCENPEAACLAAVGSWMWAGNGVDFVLGGPLLVFSRNQTTNQWNFIQ